LIKNHEGILKDYGNCMDGVVVICRGWFSYRHPRTNEERQELYRHGQYHKAIESIDADDLPMFKNADWRKDFAIAVWRGEWTEYYFSWSDSYSENWSWDSGFFMLAAASVTGFLPVLACGLSGSKKGKW
jgi:hypothetical protein